VRAKTAFRAVTEKTIKTIRYNTPDLRSVLS